jgi:hypothetical protein
VGVRGCQRKEDTHPSCRPESVGRLRDLACPGPKWAASQGNQHWIKASIVVPSDIDDIDESSHFVVDRVKEEILLIERGGK